MRLGENDISALLTILINGLNTATCIDLLLKVVVGRQSLTNSLGGGLPFRLIPAEDVNSVGVDVHAQA